jgi:hypothetical protein
MRPPYRGEDGDLRSFRELAGSSKASHSTRAPLAAGAIDCGHCWPVGALMGRFDLDHRCDPRAPLTLREKSPAVASVAPTSVLRRPRRSGTLRIVVNLAGGCAQHDTTWEFPVADPLASATEREVQELARPFWSRARSKTSQMDPRLSL